LRTHDGNAYTFPTDMYRLSNVKYDDVIADYVSIREFEAMKSHPLLRPHDNRPLYIKTKDGVKVYTGAAADNSVTQVTASDKVNIDYIKKPATVSWGYIVVSGSALYNSGNSTNFELHESEEVNLVNRILVLAGIMMKDPTLYQTISGEEMKDIQQEKQ